MDESSINRFLEELGLTEYEAKTLSALFRSKEAEAPQISRLAQVPKTRVYDVLDRLINKKLVIEMSGRPKKYRVVDAGEALNELLQKKRQEIQELEKRAAEAKQSLSFTGSESESDGERVIKVKDKRDFEKILGQEIERAKRSVLAFTEIGREKQGLLNSFIKARNNKAEVKVVGVVAKGPGRFSSLFSEPGIDLKHFDHGMDAFVIDGKKVVLALSDFRKEKPEYHFTIWNNHPSLSSALGLYFSDCWKKGKRV